MRDRIFNSLKYIKAILMVIVFLTVGILIGIRVGKIGYINKIYKKEMKINKELNQAKYYLYSDGYIFRYAKASFWNSRCFASVSSEEDEKLYLSEKGILQTKGMQITLYIWPLEGRYGLYFYQCSDGETINEQVYIDKNMKCMSENEEYSSYINLLIDENREKIEDLFWEAYRQWYLS